MQEKFIGYDRAGLLLEIETSLSSAQFSCVVVAYLNKGRSAVWQRPCLLNSSDIMQFKVIN